MTKSISIEELFERLNSKQFQKEASDIFYNYYIYLYPASQEYEMRKQIAEFKERLKRPNSYANPMTLDLFDTFCEFLKTEHFGPQNMLDVILEQDKVDADSVTQALNAEAESDAFLMFVRDKINAYLNDNDGLNKPYIFVYGIGKMFPYLRTNTFLTQYEKYNETDKYKIILFYPGEKDGNSFSLFNKMHDDHTYRAILLVNE